MLWVLTMTALADPAHSPILPDPRLTPGDVLTTDAQAVCTPGYSRSVRDVPTFLKQQVYRSYGVVAREPCEYEIDHLISLELGGSNSIRNLWPESAITQPLNSHTKDRIENKLHPLVCAGPLSLEQAQREIAADWTAAYRHYLGPLPTLFAPSEAVGFSRAVTAAQAAVGVVGNPDGSCPPNAPVKVSRSGIYHVPVGDPNFNRTKARTCFATSQSAEQAGYRAPKR